ncbi:hypothetical protein JX265_008816 [Neoarthrinium moseri]|uniref:Glutathione S-transferase n=1 Tax=Neoarthrinium moseri TaxID=1658444 RepID=A0A9Q0ANC3_9PEZI|nr:hypothetical protein JX265_008816 [Neoarthrinium moseri]
MTETNITLYTTRTPNGQKASIALEELGLNYKVHAIDLSKDEQKEPWFLEINPNGRIPAITDTFTDGSAIRVFESGSILQYLADRQANHFFRYAPEKIKYGIDRYQNETRRLYRVMDKHLSASASGFLVGDHCTIADIACWGWVASASWAGVDIDEFPALKEWKMRCWARPAFVTGHGVPAPKEQQEKKSEEHAREASTWIMRGMKEDAAKK